MCVRDNNYYLNLAKLTSKKTDCAESPFKHILPKSKLARDLKDVFKRFVYFPCFCMTD